ncbi:MAG: polyphosphate polymerase domain-containing protein [Prevotellaceae bacterium]|jgi:hypothetical protein|nr:polyphosphate polymerase domain-containing protein [Prevotellaceae bacterium]
MNTALQYLHPIDLSEMSAIKLMNRVDTKYMTNQRFLPDLLAQAAEAGYRVQVVEDSQVGLYRTLYYDTPDAEMYHTHHNQKLQRQKIRTRTYLTSAEQTTYLEIKNKTNKGRTKKKRIEILPADFFNFKNDENAVGFFRQHSPYNTNNLVPQVSNTFDRITLVNAAKTERLTIDYRLHFDNLYTGKTVDVPDIAIIELKQDGLCHSQFKDFLLDARIKPVSISKYCLGTILTNDTVKSNRFKKKMMYLEKLIT